MKSIKTPIAISGIGCVTCVGSGVQSLWDSALQGRMGIVEGLGKVNGFEATETSRAVAIATESISEALLQAGWSGLEDNDGLIIATTTGQIGSWENELTEFVRHNLSLTDFDKAWKSQTLGSIVGAISKKLNYSGKTLLLTSACSAATQAIALGSLWIEKGYVNRCLVGGVETLSHLTTEGFRALQLLASNPAAPFDQNRNGINLGEGAGFLCLEKQPKVTLAYVSGFGLSTDAYHMTAPHPEGRGSLEAMSSALRTAHLMAKDIGWIHAHGTGSQANDLAEGQAISQLFGTEPPWTTSTKGVHGHTLGASGAIESILCVKALEEQRILKTLGLKTPDPLIQLRHPTSSLKMNLKHVLKNTLGFGGNNAALVFSHHSTKYDSV